MPSMNLFLETNSDNREFCMTFFPAYDIAIKTTMFLTKVVDKSNVKMLLRRDNK